MEIKDVTMWGRDYSAREFTDADFDRYQRENPRERPVQFLGRYIGYPQNRKCISYYPGMYQHHWGTGRPVFLFHQIGYTDMEGGEAAGRAHARTALADARRVGWDGESHIVACMDRFYAKAGLRTLTPMDLRYYMQGFRSVLGDRTGFYGFYDSMRDAVVQEWAHFFVQCGARSAHVRGIHCWQENNYQPSIFGTGTDVLELYCSREYAFGGTDDTMAFLSQEEQKELLTRTRDIWRALFDDKDNPRGQTLYQAAWSNGDAASALMALVGSKQGISVDELVAKLQPGLVSVITRALEGAVDKIDDVELSPEARKQFIAELTATIGQQLAGPLAVTDGA